MPFDVLTNPDTYWVMPNNKQIATMIEEVINERGWCKGQKQSTDGRVCLIGAIEIVVERIEPPEELFHAMIHKFACLTARNICSKAGRGMVPRWNDSITTTITDIHELLGRMKLDTNY
jgi:hypothetical protein